MANRTDESRIHKCHHSLIFAALNVNQYLSRPTTSSAPKKMLMSVHSCETFETDGSDVASRYQWSNQANLSNEWSKNGREKKEQQNMADHELSVATVGTHSCVNKYLRTMGFNFSAAARAGVNQQEEMNERKSEKRKRLRERERERERAQNNINKWRRAARI